MWKLLKEKYKLKTNKTILNHPAPETFHKVGKPTCKVNTFISEILNTNYTKSEGFSTQ